MKSNKTFVTLLSVCALLTANVAPSVVQGAEMINTTHQSDQTKKKENKKDEEEEEDEDNSSQTENSESEETETNPEVEKPEEEKPEEEKPEEELPEKEIPEIENPEEGNQGETETKPKPEPEKEIPKEPETGKPGVKPQPTAPQREYVNQNNVGNPQSNNQVDSTSAGDVSEGSYKITKTATGEEFVKSIGEVARKVAGENDLYASVMIAQAALESGYGNSGLARAPHNNLFGIKGSYQGKSVKMATLEDGKSGMYQTTASFRSYPSAKESLEDYAELLKKGITSNNMIYQGAWKSKTKNYREATKHLTGLYATDKEYNKKLNGIIEAYGLTKYDVTIPLIDGESFFSKPLTSYTVTSKFGYREAPTAVSGNIHKGIDLAAAENTEVKVSAAGEVVATGFDASAGNYVIVRHSNELYTNYFHLNHSAVAKGNKVEAGQVIGFVGSTGDSTGAHLHFGISTDVWDGYIDPMEFVAF